MDYFQKTSRPQKKTITPNAKGNNGMNNVGASVVSLLIPGSDNNKEPMCKVSGEAG